MVTEPVGSCDVAAPLCGIVERCWAEEPSKRPGFPKLARELELALPQASAPTWDVFLSYRVSADLELAEKLFDKLSLKGLRIWWDRACLAPGQPFEEGFADGLLGSTLFVPILSKAALKPFGELAEDSWCDNVLLEYRLALELKERGDLLGIFPILVGEVHTLDGAPMYGDFFSAGGKPTCADVTVSSVESKLSGHLERQGKGPPKRAGPHATISKTLSDVMANQGNLLKGDKMDAVELCVTRVCHAVRAAVTSLSGGDIVHDRPVP